jgi:Mn2+/Fe2+ NRAMP family transporter
VALAALVVVGAAFTGSFRRFERIAVAFCAGSLLLIPVYFLSHPPVTQMAHDFVIPHLPGGAGQLSTVMLLIIGIVGTTVAPWQLFFQQSYVIDKRITPRFIRYEKADLWIGIAIVVLGGSALMGATAAAFAGTHAVGHSPTRPGWLAACRPTRAARRVCCSPRCSCCCCATTKKSWAPGSTTARPTCSPPSSWPSWSRFQSS